MNEIPLLYRIVISEDPLNEDITPAYEYGAKLQTDYFLNIFKQNLPQLDLSYKIKLKIIQKNYP